MFLLWKIRLVIAMCMYGCQNTIARSWEEASRDKWLMLYHFGMSPKESLRSILLE